MMIISANYICFTPIQRNVCACTEVSTPMLANIHLARLLRCLNGENGAVHFPQSVIYMRMSHAIARRAVSIKVQKLMNF